MPIEQIEKDCDVLLALKVTFSKFLTEEVEDE